jgi:hypothetical protein
MSRTLAAVASAAIVPPPSNAIATPQARQRLRLGITGVGASVVLSLSLIASTLLGRLPLRADWRLVSGWIGVPLSAATLAVAVFVAHALAMVFIEHAGGRLAVRQAPSLRTWLLHWLRGIGTIGALHAAAVAVVVTAGVLGGTAAATVVVLAMSFALLAAQGTLAQLVAALRVERPSDALAARAREVGIRPDALRVVEASDEAFVGGWIGFGAPQLWVPAAWTTPEQSALLAVQWQRRRAQFTSLARRRGWWRAVVWPAAGVALTVSLMPWGWTDARLWLVLPALSTLWSFVAVLVLPSASRAAVFFADAEAARVLGRDQTIAALARLEAAQDDEAERDPLVELVFHPVPSVGNRKRRLESGRWAPLGGGHQQTRLTLLSSLAAGSFLGRMVHCNIGRPALWVVYPGD